MDTFESRLPPTRVALKRSNALRQRLQTRQETRLLLLATIVPVHFWTVLIFLNELPAYLHRMTIWDMIGVFAYTQIIALIDSLLFFGLINFVSFCLPPRLFKDQFVAQGMIVMLLSFIGIIPLHFQNQILERLAWDVGRYHLLTILWIAIFLGAILSFSALIRRRQPLANGLQRLADRLTPLAAWYLLVDLGCLMILVFRSIA